MKNLYLQLSVVGLLILGGISIAFGQAALIRGNVTDAESGLPIVGATIRAFQNNNVYAGAFSDVDGDYQMKVEPGPYTLLVTYVSFRTDTIAVTATTEEITILKTLMIPAVTELDAVEIVAEGNKQTVDNLIRQKQNSVNTIDGIPFELMQRTGVSDAAGALQRVTGVSVTEGKYVSVRGLSDRYNRTLINMGEIPPLDPDKETVQMDRFPTNLIDNIIVYKNFTPDLPGSFTAGLIDVQTKSNPTQFEMTFRASSSYNDVSNLRDDWLTYDGGALDWLGIDDGTRALPAEGEAPPDFYTMKRVASGLNQSYAFTIGDQVELFGRPFGYVAAITYRNNFQNFSQYEVGRYNIITDGDTTFLDGSLENGFGTRHERDVLAGGIISLSYKPSPKSKLQFTYMRSQGSTNRTIEQAGLNATDSEDLRINNVMYFSQQGLNSYQLRGKHTAGPLAIDWVATQSYSDMEEPDFRILPYDAVILDSLFIIRDTVGFDSLFFIWIVNDTFERVIDTTNTRQQVAASTQDNERAYRALQQQTSDIKLNITWPLPVFPNDKRKVDIKFGGAFTNKERDFRNDILRVDQVNRIEIDETGGFFETSAPLFAPPGEDLNYTPVTVPGVPYNAYQRVYAGYLMTEAQPFTRLSFILGARYEYTDMFIDGNGTGVGVDNGFITSDLLPAFHLIYRPFKNVNVRAGYSRTLARPSFRETALFVNAGFSGDYRVAGSPFTNRSLIDNLDLRIEWFPSRGELISVGGYYKEILGPIELNIVAAGGENLFVEYRNLRTTAAVTDPIQPIIPKDLTDENSELLGGDLAVALAYGLEVEIRKNFGFLGEGWEKLQFWGNYSLLRTEVALDEDIVTGLQQEFGELLGDDLPTRRQLYGQPSYTLNTELAFVDREKLGLDVSVSYNQFGDRLVLVLRSGINIIEKSRGLLNVSVRKQLGEHFAIRARANNLLNPAYRQVYEILGLERDLAVYENSFRGRTYSLGVTYDF